MSRNGMFLIAFVLAVLLGGCIRYDRVIPAFDDGTKTIMLENENIKALVDAVTGNINKLALKSKSGKSKTAELLSEDLLNDKKTGDYPWKIISAEPNKRIILKCACPDLAGVSIEKEIFLKEQGTRIDVTLRIANNSDQVKKIALRVRNIVPAQSGIFTYPMDAELPWEILRVYDRRKQSHGQLEITSPAASWAGYFDSAAESGLVFLYDVNKIKKVFSWFGMECDTLEWYYESLEVPAGETVKATYSIAGYFGISPPVSASENIVLGLTPLRLNTDKNYTVSLFRISGDNQAMLSIAGTTADDKALKLNCQVDFSSDNIFRRDLPWQNQKIKKINFSVKSGRDLHEAELAQVDDSSIYNLPQPAGFGKDFKSIVDFFPYGEYIRTPIGKAIVSQNDAYERIFRIYAFNYFNTVTVGDNLLLDDFAKTGKSVIAELARKYGMRLIPKTEMIRKFVDKKEVFEKYDKEQLLEMYFTEDGYFQHGDRRKQTFSFDLRENFAQVYGDVILAYDVSDEPGPGGNGEEAITTYVNLRDIFSEIDSEHPATVILNMSRYEWLPYVPVYYGDSYPVRKKQYGGRNPWKVEKEVGQVVAGNKNKVPVWVMLAAFGQSKWELPDEAETRLMIYSVLANGGKGIIWHGSFSSPCWRYNHHYFFTFIDSWGVAAPAWEAVRAAGSQIRAIAPLLTGTDLQTNAPFRVAGGEIDIFNHKFPAIKIGALKEKKGDGCFLVAVNQDVKNERTGTIVSAEKENENVLLDLYEFKEVDQNNKDACRIRLIPGDGKIFYYGAQKRAVEILNIIQKNHYEKELLLYNLKKEMALANNVDIGVSLAFEQKAVKCAADPESHGKYAAACENILLARAKLNESIQSDKVLGAVLKNMQDSLALLSEISGVYRSKFDVIMPEDSKKKTPQYAVMINKEDAKMQKYLDITAECFGTLIKYDTLVLQGARVRNCRRKFQSVNNRDGAA